MSRVLKIMSIAVVLFLAYMWISVLTKSCNKSNQSALKPKQETAKDTNEFGSEEFFNEDSTTADEDTSIDYKEIDATIEKAVDNAKSKPEEKTAEKPVQKATPSSDLTTVKEKTVPTKKVPEARNMPEAKTTPISRPEALAKTQKTADPAASQGGNFIVVAGNYLVEPNADAMLKKLKKSGFNGAEKVVFDLSEFFTVIAGRYNSQDAASRAISSLKAKGIDAYMHRKK